ncbi:sulfolactate dehydrogenase [Niveispirillum lacus]|uniref:Sulfolactate dehydrogenase n=2 Tax=Niveispirillum lacus TaxID=1981099 RepID=A0A255Z0X1_9PROT|nr:sulfolactate dehydrogenase [Niveispirillum lacus]
MDTVTLGLETARHLAVTALNRAGVTLANANPTADALLAAEMDGQAGHGLSRVPSYCLHARVGKVDGAAMPTASPAGKAGIHIDAGHGFAYPAIDLAINHLLPLAAEMGVAAAAIRRSHHFGQAGRHVERLADQGLVALAFANTPAALPLPGGRRSLMGTNPIAFAAPLSGRPPLVVDMALSVAARGKIMAASKAGRPIPEGWAVDAAGHPTTDADAALGGSLLPMGGAKGAALALMVEVICAALAGGSFGWHASGLFDGQGGPPDLGQLLIVLNPACFGGDHFADRMAALLLAVAQDAPARLPGDRRLAMRQTAAREGVTIPMALHREILDLTRP